MASTAESRFGRYLKRLRAGRKLTLREVADLSERLSLDSAGRFSHAYLSQLESGIRVALSLPKALSLAAIYATRPEDVISHAPSTLRSDLLRQLAELRESQGLEPAPLRRLPRQIRRISDHMNEEVQSRTDLLFFPGGVALDCLMDCRDALLWATIVPFLESALSTPGIVSEFRVAYGDPASDYLKRAHLADLRTAAWYSLCDEFLNWLVYERENGPELLRIINRWSIDFASGYRAERRLSCSFNDPQSDRRFGFANLPIGALEAVRWRQLARMLFEAGMAGDLPDRPEPPPIGEAAVDALWAIVEPEMNGPVTDLGARVGLIVERLGEFVRVIPSLHGTPGAPVRAEVAAIADLLSKATERAAPSSGRD